MQITAEMVAEAEAEVTEAERVRAMAEEALMEAPNSTVKSQALAAALQRVAQGRANARELGEAFEEQVAAERAAATREELEKAAAVEIRAADRELRAGVGALEAAAVRAQEGLVALMVAAGVYGELVERHAGVLEAAGLGLDGATGGGHRMLDTAVRVRGTSYESAAPAGVLLWVASRVAEARLPQLNPTRASLAGLAGYGAWERREDGLLSGVPAVPAVKFPEPPRLVNAFQAQLAARK